MMLRYRHKHALVGMALLVATVMVGGPTYAYWRGVGSGGGSGSAGSTVPVTLSLGAATASLFPGGQADVSLTFSNPNSASVRVTSLVLDPTQGTGGFSVDAYHSGCAVSTFTFTTQNNGGAGWTIAPRSGSTNGSLAVTLVGAIGMSLSAANACQGAVPTVYLAAT